ncbi:MAG: OmpW family protein [Lysobacteraceae bacterium]|nr:MAG: OmpW family protein [Xanthomonadaceae bacterium]
MKTILPLAMALLGGLSAASAAEPGDWELKVGVHAVDPASDNGRLAGGTLEAGVDDAVGATFVLEYRVRPHLGLEVLAALPFKHEVTLDGGKAATVRQLPPTVSAQWHFIPQGTVDPFVGLGLNYTRFFSIDETGPLDGTRVELGDSWGLAAHAGVAFALQDRWSLTLDLRWIDIESEVKVNGVKVGTVDIDPLVYGAALGYRF